MREWTNKMPIEKEIILVRTAILDMQIECFNEHIINEYQTYLDCLEEHRELGLSEIDQIIHIQFIRDELGLELDNAFNS